jgi:hypothetical protein
MNSLSTRGVQRVGKNCDALRHAIANKIGGFERPGPVCINRYHDDIGWLNWVIGNKRPSRREYKQRRHAVPNLPGDNFARCEDVRPFVRIFSLWCSGACIECANERPCAPGNFDCSIVI